MIILDGHPGQIKEVCLPGTQLADVFDCKETGGLLILFDDGILTLLPFGNSHCIEKHL